MTIFFPDISGYQAGISLTGAPAVIIKVTEGTGWADSAYGASVARAHAAGAFVASYHFLHAGNAATQAAFCHSRAGDVPLMLDFEPTGTSVPMVGDATRFIDAYRALGGTCNLLYFPHWYWQQIGSPSLAPFVQRGMALVSSAYTTYSDTGPGWNAYGGMTPTIWQYSDSTAFHGQQVDFNAYRGTVDQLRAIATRGSAAPVPAPAPTTWQETMMQQLPTLRQGASGGPVRTVQGLLTARGYSLTVDGVFGPATDTVVKRFQGNAHLTADGVVGPLSWRALMDVA